MPRTLAIVGNGEMRGGAAEAIDAADLVIRFNECRSYGSGGARTDVVAVCNTGLPAKTMLGSARWRTHPAVAAATEIWSVRDPAKFAEMRPLLAFSHPELDDFCDDYTGQFGTFCTATGKTHLVIERTIHEAMDHALLAFEPERYVVPSSGMIVIGSVLERFPGHDIVLAGFDHSGWEWHPFAAERRLVEHYIAAGRISRVGAGLPARSREGV
ncbi:MAG: Urease operon accessory protein [Rhizobiaceae bacterium]